MIWERSSKTLLPEFFIKDIPACLPSSSALLLQIKFGSADLQAKYQLFSAPPDVSVPGPSSSVVIEEFASDDHSCTSSLFAGGWDVARSVTNGEREREATVALCEIV